MYRLWKILLSNMSRPETFGMALVHLLLMLSTTIHHASIKMCHFYFWNNSMKNCLILILLLFGKQHHLRDDTIRHHCMDQPTVGKRVQWNRLWWFGHVCRMDDSCLPKQLPWAERLDGWRCPSNAPKKQKSQCYDSSLQAPLPWPFDGGHRHDNWAWCMAGVTVRHQWHQPTSWPIKRSCTSRCLERHSISADPMRSKAASWRNLM